MSGVGTDELMTDDEFERLLDTLQDDQTPASTSGTTGQTASPLTIDTLVIDDTGDWLPRLRTELERNEVIEIDLGSLASIDTAGLQLLLSVRQSAERAGKTVDYRSPSATFVQAVGAIGLSEAFGIASGSGVATEAR